MPNQRSNAQSPLLTLSDKIRLLQSDMVRLTAHTQQQAPALRNLMQPTQPFVNDQNACDPPLGAHLQMCSFHGCCTHNNASCPAQHPNSASPSNTVISSANPCYFCQMRVHPID
uniref:Uncharacterized protein n=1 Tax=Romanomermis culicivorax TaxID=13658 RepID=A0A915K345_ROMCU